MHNRRLADPFDPITKSIKRITSKREKSEEDQLEILHLEYLGGLYLDSNIGPYIPGENIARCLKAGAQIKTAGPKVDRGLFISSDINPFSYRGPRTPETLWADDNFRLIASVRLNGRTRMQRCRPLFREWTVEAEGVLDTRLLGLEQLQEFAELAGSMIGLGDWHPRYGRFTAEVRER